MVLRLHILANVEQGTRFFNNKQTKPIADMVNGGPTRRRIKTEEKTKVVAAVWGTEFFQFLAALDIIQEDDFEKRMNRIMSTWRNGCFENMDDPTVYTIPNHYTLLKWMYSIKCLFKSSLLLNG